MLAFVRKSSCPDAVRLFSFDGVLETLPTDRAFGTHGPSELDGLLTGLLVREILGEENVGEGLAGRLSRFECSREIRVVSPVAHTIRI